MEPKGQLARWLMELQEFEFLIQHRLGKPHRNADALSRLLTNLTVKAKHLTITLFNYVLTLLFLFWNLIDWAPNFVSLLHKNSVNLQLNAAVPVFQPTTQWAETICISK